MFEMVLSGLALIAAVSTILYAVIKGMGLLREDGGAADTLLALNLLEAGISPLYMWLFGDPNRYFQIHWLDLAAPGTGSFSAHLQTLVIMYGTLVGLLLIMPLARLAARDPWQRFVARHLLPIGVARLAMVVTIFELIGIEQRNSIHYLALSTVPTLVLIGSGVLFWSVRKVDAVFDAMISAQTRGFIAPDAQSAQSVTLLKEGVAIGSSDDARARPLL